MDNKKKHLKKMIAPIVISSLVILYYGVIIWIFAQEPAIPVLVKIGAAIIPLAVAITMIAVLVSRIKEIRSGEEDDLSKY